MPFWLAVLVMVGITIGLELLKPKPKVPNATAKTFGDFGIPTAEETRVIPYAAGTVRQSGANVIWAGDYDARPIKRRVRTSMFTSKTQIAGYRYHVGMALALCHGVVDEVQEITMEDGKYQLWTGSLTANGQEITILKEELFGGESSESGSAEGGINVTLRFYRGDRSQTADAYLQGQTGGSHPAYRGLAYLIWQGPSGGALFSGGVYVSGGGYTGTSGYLKAIEVIFKRIPKSLAPDYADINGDANPIEVIYEIMTSYSYGSNYDPSQLGASFAAAAAIVHGEGLGVSFIQDSPVEVETLVQEMLKVVDGVIYSDLETGLLEIALIRADYSPAGLLLLSDLAGVASVEFTRSGWDETVNEIVVNYIDPSIRYKSRPYRLPQIANYNLQGGHVVAQTMEYKGIRSGETAARLASRDLRVMSSPLARVTVRADRRAYALRPGSVFRLSWAPLGIADMIFRVVEIRYGRLGESAIEIEAVEDVFAAGAVVFDSPIGGGGVSPVTTPAAVSTQLVIEQPYLFSGAQARAWAAARPPSGLHLSWDAYLSLDAGSTYSLRAEGLDFCPTGLLTAPYAALTAAIDAGGTLSITPEGNLPLYGALASEIAEGSNLAAIVGAGGEIEFIAFENPIYGGGGTITFDKVWRGLLDTPPRAHASGARMWFLSYGSLLLQDSLTPGSTVKLKHLTRTTRGALSLASAAAFDLVLPSTARHVRPLLPGDLRINGNYLASTVSGDIALTWAHRDRTQQSTVISQSAAGVGPEAGTTYEVRVYGGAGKTLIHTETGLSGTGWTWTSAAEIAAAGGLYIALEFRVRAMRSGIDSLFDYVRSVTRSDGTLP